MQAKKRNVLDLARGESSKIKHVEVGTCACKLMTLGLLPKSTVRMIRKSPLGDAYLLKINDHFIAVRADEAITIIID